VADDRESGIAAIALLKQNDQGRVELIVADVNANTAGGSVTNVAGVRAAAEVVQAPSGILALLADVLIVDDLDAARELYRADSNAKAKTLITLDGDVLSEKIIRGGSRSTPSKLQLISERDAAEARLTKVNELIETSRAELAQARATEEAAKQSAKEALAALNEHDAQLAQNAEKLSRVRVQVDAATGRS